MSAWWLRYEEKLPRLSSTQRVRIEYLTGSVPLLLRPLLRYSREIVFETLEAELIQCDEWHTVSRNVAAYAENKHRSLSNIEFET
jgi:hypothetical protein